MPASRFRLVPLKPRGMYSTRCLCANALGGRRRDLTRTCLTNGTVAFCIDTLTYERHYIACDGVNGSWLGRVVRVFTVGLSLHVYHADV